MSGLGKKLAVKLLAPAARLVQRGELLRRAWAHARLQASIASTVDPTVVILGVAEVVGSGRIALGKRLFLYRELYWETQDQGEIRIGDDVVMSRGVHIVAFARVTIGDGVMIGEYASIRDANHRLQSGQSVRWTGHDARPVHIERNTWIGRGVTILPGVTVGEGAIVGANAVVTRDVAAGSVVAGVPAKVIGSG